MYLSQLTLNPRHRQVCNELARPYEMHRTLTSRCFHADAITAQKNVSRANAEGAHGLLFRLDVARSNGDLVLLAQSQVKPDWGNLPQGYALHVQGPKDFDLRGKLAAGQTFGFRLRASPTKRIGNSTKFKQDVGKRVAIKIEADQMKWLERKGEQHGFELRKKIVGDQTVFDTIVSSEGNQFGNKADERGVHEMRWHSVVFSGTLIVKDPAQLWLAVQSGIGTAKGMGFGLLSLSLVASHQSN
jgi:CRISPR system Cascade subunit CasE